MKSSLELSLEQELFSLLDRKALEVARIISDDEEINAWQEFANTVSIRRLGYNDHGPVHMRKVAVNSMKMFNILTGQGIVPNIVKEGSGGLEDSRIAVLLASFLHDIGMSVGRHNHEISSFTLAAAIIDRVLQAVFPDDLMRRVVIKSVALESILGHMTEYPVTTLEAGIVLIADGCDMEKGRSRIPLLLRQESRMGDIHKYSSSAIETVSIEKGEEKPLKITVEMTASVGFFQVEEILMGKIMASTVKPYIELYAYVAGRDVKRYL
jgi:metal-dependent HD superfamily phosphatase/phosphodiesterase